MRQHEHELQALGIKVAIVTFQSGPLVEAYARETSSTWPILIDDTLSVYRSYRMDHGRWWNIWGPATLWTYAKLLLRGRRLQDSNGDVSQLGGNILIDPGGYVRLHHVGKSPADRPTVESILGVVRNAES